MPASVYYLCSWNILYRRGDCLPISHDLSALARVNLFTNSYRTKQKFDVIYLKPDCLKCTIYNKKIKISTITFEFVTYIKIWVKVKCRQRSGINTIKYTTPDPGHHMGKGQNPRKHHIQKAKRSAISQQMTSRLQETDMKANKQTNRNVPRSPSYCVYI